jgi:hypothetical protein
MPSSVIGPPTATVQPSEGIDASYPYPVPPSTYPVTAPVLMQTGLNPVFPLESPSSSHPVSPAHRFYGDLHQAAPQVSL